MTSNGSTILTGWVDDPNGRSTFTIISSCVLTLSLCVYTAIHLNVRPHKQTEPQSWIETTKWVLFGICAPELLLYVAWRQYVSATALNRIVKSLQETEQLPGPLLRQRSDDSKGISFTTTSHEYHLHNPWTRTHSFYANMGGFVFDLEDASLAEGEAFTTAKHSILTVTPRGMALLARCGYLPKISREDILDKSKSDNLSKVLSILQALWMLSQIVGRLIVKLPITLLEINTLAHILSALIIYMLWWNKPKLINEPTRLRGDWVAPICAYMYMSSQISGWKSMKPGILQKTWMEPEFSILAFKPHEDPRLVNQISVDDKSSVQAMITAVASPQSVYTEAGVVNPPSIASGEFTTRPIPSFRTSRMTASSIASILESRLESSRELRSTRWALAAEAMNIHPAIASRVIPRETVINGKQVSWFEPVLEELVNDSMGNWVTDNLLKDISGFVMGMTVWSASMAYGGMHAIAWKSYFPSKTEALLWRASSVIIAGSGLVWVMLNMLARTFKGFHTYWKRVEYLHAHWASLVGLGSTATICGLLYILARVYLVIEAFISLRQLPELAYETLQWTQLVPHL